jgi:hypothetical protein
MTELTMIEVTMTMHSAVWPAAFATTAATTTPFRHSGRAHAHHCNNNN